MLDVFDYCRPLPVGGYFLCLSGYKAWKYSLQTLDSDHKIAKVPAKILKIDLQSKNTNIASKWWNYWSAAEELLKFKVI